MIIKQKTVFVLGAGASSPFGLPLGKDLKRKICELNHASVARAISSEPDEQKDAQEAIYNLQSSFARSNIESIDLFLSKNPKFVNLGKQLIAAVLYPLEIENNLHNIENNENWCRFLWNNINTDFDKIDKHDLHFITFNYDRSLEHFLYLSLYNSYSGNKSSSECAEIIKKINIKHVYGSLSPLNWQVSDGRAYSARQATREDLSRAVINLKLLGEERGEADYKEIQTLMRDAVNIYFIGFAFDEFNLDLLGKIYNAERIWGTSFELPVTRKNRSLASLYERSAKKGSIEHYGSKLPGVALWDLKAMDFLKAWVFLT